MISNIKIGDKIGEKFEVVAIFGGEGKSGMGVVYFCRGIGIDGFYALKTFQDQFIDSEDMKENFKQEALAWISLGKHANIVTAYSFDIIDDRPFIFIEFIVPNNNDQNTLNDFLKTDLSEIQILEWSIQVCHAMEHAKSKKVSPYRDIKPDNIMITNDKVLKITDFGLARLWNGLRIEKSSQENFSDSSVDFLHNGHTQLYSGTPEYMAPEQFEGKANEISDVYSFGVVLYQMINNGIHPFSEVDISKIDSNQYPYKDEEPAELRSDIFPIAKKCLNKNSENRYPSFEALRNDLEELYLEKTGNYPPEPPTNAELEADEHVNRGYALDKLRFINEAISEFQKAKNLDPELFPARINLAIMFIKTDQYDNAINELEKAIEIDPKNADAHYNLGICYNQNMQYKEAIREFKIAIKLNPSCKEAHVNLGRIFDDRNQLDPAITEYEKALKIDSKFFEALMNLGIAYTKKNRYDDAISIFEKAKEINPNDPGLYNSWGNALSKKGEEDKAIGKYVKALTLKSEFSKAHNNFGLSWDSKGRTDLAIHEFNEAINCDPENVGAYMNLGSVYVKMGEFNKAIQQFKTVIKIDPKFIEAKISLSHVLIYKKDYDGLISLYDDYESSNPKIAHIYNALGIAHSQKLSQKGEYEKAKNAFEKAISVSPEVIGWQDHVGFRKNYGKLLLNCMLFKEAATQYEHARNIDSKDPEIHNKLGFIYNKLNRRKDAIREYEKTLKTDPNNETAKLCLDRIKNPEKYSC